MEEPVNPTTVSTPERAGEAGGVLHFLGGALAYAFRLAVTPHLGADDRFVAEVDGVIAHGLTFEVVGDGPDLQVVLLQHGELGFDVAGFVPAPGVQVVSGDGDLQAVIAPARGKARDFLKGEVGPLAGEQGERPGLLIGHDSIRSGRIAYAAA